MKPEDQAAFKVACQDWAEKSAGKDLGEYFFQAALAHRDAQPTVACSFPERDVTKPTEEQGLFRKFDVRRVDGSDAPGGKHHGCEYFVLDLNHDTHAPAALRAYAQACNKTHPQLSAELLGRFGPQPAVAVNEQMYNALKMVMDDPQSLEGRPRTFECVTEAIGAYEAAKKGGEM